MKYLILFALSFLFFTVSNAAAENRSEQLVTLFEEANYAGEVLIAKKNDVIYAGAFGTVTPGGDDPHELGSVWRWASVSKQVTAILVMQEVASGNIELDAVLSDYLSNSQAPYADDITVRQLMQHLSGLRHTDSVQDAAEHWPRFYTGEGASTGRTYCEGQPAAPPGIFRYNNCDYIMLEAVLAAVTGLDYKRLLEHRITNPLGLETVGLFPVDEAAIPGFVGGEPEADGLKLENYGAAGALYGSASDLLTFNRALLAGDLLPDHQREVMWQGDPTIGYVALGQWAFPARLADCLDDTRIVERRGAIGGVQVLNLLLPEYELSLIMLTNRSEADFSFGEIWAQQGLAHDVLNGLICF